MKKIAEFYKSHKILCWILFASVLVVLFYLFTVDVPEAFHNAGEWLAVLETVALSYIASFIFYILQVFIPEEQKIERLNKCIKQYTDSIVSYINGMFESIATQNINHTAWTVFAKEDMDKLAALPIESKIEVNKISTEKLINGKFSDEKFTIREWILTQAYRVNEEVDHVLSYYGFYIDPEILETIEAIRKTEFMRNIVPFLREAPVSFQGSHYWTFYEAGQKLKEVADKKLI